MASTYSAETSPTRLSPPRLSRISSEDEITDASLRIWLRTRGLAQYYPMLRELGAKRVSDLAHLTEEDLKEMNLDE